MTTPPDGLTDRRQHHGVRAVFDEAYAAALPYLDPAQGIQGVALTHQVAVMLQERFPQLDAQERAVLAAALRGAFQRRPRA